MSKKKTPTPNIPKETLLRMRLDGLWQNPALPTQSETQIDQDLTMLTRGLAPAVVLPVVAQALAAAPMAAQARLGEMLPAWLAAQNYQPALEALLRKPKLGAEVKATLQHWFTTLGGVLPAVESTFYCAFYTGVHQWQSALTILWYTDARRTRARGVNLLIDRNPPWYGALKDLMLWPQKSAEEWPMYLQEAWAMGGAPPMAPIAAVEAKQVVVAALQVNQARGIRLSRDLLAAREHFVNHILTLPDAPATPAFTLADFNALAQAPHSPEDIMRFEQTQGRVVLEADGSRLFLDAALIDGPWDEDDEDEEIWDELAKSETGAAWFADQVAKMAADMETTLPAEEDEETAAELALEAPASFLPMKNLSPAQQTLLQWMMAEPPEGFVPPEDDYDDDDYFEEDDEDEERPMLS